MVPRTGTRARTSTRPCPTAEGFSSSCADHLSPPRPPALRWPQAAPPLALADRAAAAGRRDAGTGRPAGTVASAAPAGSAGRRRCRTRRRLDDRVQRRLQRRRRHRPEHPGLALRHSGYCLPGAARPDWGTGEIGDGHRLDRERLPRRSAGHLAIKPLRGRRRQLDVRAGSRPSAPTSPRRPAGSSRSARPLDSPPRPAGSATGPRVLGDGRRRPPGRRDELAEHRRARHHGGRQRAEQALHHVPLRDSGRASATTRTASPATCRPAPAARAASTPIRWSLRTQHRRRAAAVPPTRRRTRRTRSTENQVSTRPRKAVVDHGFFAIFDVAIGGSYPNKVCGWLQPSVGHHTRAPAMSVDWFAPTRPPPRRRDERRHHRRDQHRTTGTSSGTTTGTSTGTTSGTSR